MPYQIAILTLAGALTGLLSGLFGVGGGIILVPIMVLCAVPIHQAVSLSLVYVFLTSLSGTYAHFRQHPVPWLTVLVLVAGASAAIYGGTRAAAQMPDTLLTLLFAALLALVLILFLLKTVLQAKDAQSVSALPLNARAWGGLLLIGLAAGWVSGMFGIGGGFLMVPLLVVMLNYSMKQSVGISLAAIIFIAGIGIVPHFFYGALAEGLKNYGLALALMGLAGMGTARLGAWVSQRLPEKQLRYAFLLFTILACLYMMIKGTGGKIP